MQQQHHSLSRVKRETLASQDKMITIILIIFVLVQISHGVLIFKCCDLDNHYVKCIKVQTARYEDTPHSDNNVENELFILNATCITGE